MGGTFCPSLNFLALTVKERERFKVSGGGSAACSLSVCRTELAIAGMLNRGWLCKQLDSCVNSWTAVWKPAAGFIFPPFLQMLTSHKYVARLNGNQENGNSFLWRSLTAFTKASAINCNGRVRLTLAAQTPKFTF